MLTLGIDGSDQTLMFSPLPTQQMNPIFSKFMPLRTLLQTYEMPCSGVEFSIQPCVYYLAANTCEQGFWSNRQACLAMTARFKRYMSLNPKSPSSFGFNNLSQLTKWILFSVFAWHHQYHPIIMLSLYNCVEAHQLSLFFLECTTKIFGKGHIIEYQTISTWKWASMMGQN